MTTASTDPEQTRKDHILQGPHETMGQYLQRARIDQELTLDSVAEVTCIHIATIKALEEDDYDKLPAEVFVRGFIKIYATLLKLDTDKALSLYQPVPVPENEDFSGRKGARQRILPGELLAEASPFTAGRQILIFLLVVAVLFFTYKAFLANPKQEGNKEAATTTEKSTITEPDQQPLPVEPTVIDPQSDAATVPIPESPKVDTDLAEEVPVAAPPHANMQLPTEEPLTSVPPTVTPEEITQPQNEELAATIPPATPHQRLIIEPHRRKTVRKPQQTATETEPATTTEKDALATEESEAAPSSSLRAESVAEETAPLLSTTAAEESATVPPSSPPTEPAVEGTVPLLNVTATTVDSAPKTENTTKPTPFVYILKANFTDLTWLEITVDSGPQRDYTFRAGEQWEWRANKEIKLHVGNAGGVTLHLNNKLIPSLGETGKSTRITLPTEPR